MNWRTMWFHLFRRKKKGEIYPDEIFLDASNLPQFDSSQFEGRLEKPLSKRSIFYFGIAFVVVMSIFVGRVFVLQVIKGKEYIQKSENNRLEHSLLFADRGIIYDRNGVEIAWNTSNEPEPYSKREYSKKEGLAHLVGYVGYPLKDSQGNYYRTDFVGKSGIERTYNKDLLGLNGLKIVEIDAQEKIHSESVIRSPQSGTNIYTSVDVRLSNKLYQFMDKLAEDSGFLGGAAVIMDVKNGEIVALTSFPEYSSEDITAGGVKVVREYISDKRKPFLNRVVSGLYTPGSIIKPFIAIGALEEGVITPEKKILSTGSLSIPNPYFPDKASVFKDWRRQGFVDMRKALAVSSNVYFYEIGGGYKDQEGLGIARIEKYVRLFGFGKKTEISVLGEKVGTIPNPAWKSRMFKDGVWRVGDTYHTAIGQYGFQVTPIQTVRAIAAIANDGFLLTPSLIRGSRPVWRKLQVAQENFSVVKEGMRMAVTEGTAKGLLIPQVKIAAKTGTAELGISKKFVNSWVIGFFPYEKPRYAFAVLMEHGPRKNMIGGLYVMRQLFEWMSINTPEYIKSE